MNVFRESASTASALDEYLEGKRRELIATSGDDVGDADAVRLREDLGGLQQRIERQLLAHGKPSVCYLVMGRVQSGKTSHQLGMLAWAADKCDVAVIFTGVTEALNGQTSHRIGRDLGTLSSNPVATLNTPTRANAERDPSVLDSVLKRAKQRKDFRVGQSMWPERLPIFVSMKTRPRVDALKWMFQEVATRLGEGVTALIIDDEADQASPNARTRRNEEAATYSELKALRDAANHHVWLSYTATPQAIFLTEQDGALRPDFCAVTRPGTGYFGVATLMNAMHKPNRIEIDDWLPVPRDAQDVRSSVKRALCDLLTSAWLRASMPDAFYRDSEGPGAEGMRSVQMLIHTSANVRDHTRDYTMVENALQQIRDGIERAVANETVDEAPVELVQAWEALSDRVQARTGGTVEMPELRVGQLWDLGNLISRIEKRVVNSDTARPNAPAGPLPTDSPGWEAHPIWIVIGGDILGRGLTFPQLVTTYFTRIAQLPNEDTVAQQMRFCGYRGTYSHVITVHALGAIFDSFEYLAQVERAVIATAEEWQDKDKDIQREKPALWYVTRPTSRMNPTRLAVRDRELVDVNKAPQVLSLRQFLQPRSFARNARELLQWVDRHGLDSLDDEWLLTTCGADDVRELLARLAMAGSDDADREIAVELMSPRLGDLGLIHMPFAVFVRHLDVIRAASAGKVPRIDGSVPLRHVAGAPPQDAAEQWRAAWETSGGLQPERWFDSARLRVQHVGDAQRRPIRQLGYDAVSVIIEPVAVYATNESDRLGAGLALSILTPPNFEVRVIGVGATS